jgi:hypothetical protein
LAVVVVVDDGDGGDRTVALWCWQMWCVCMVYGGGGGLIWLVNK